jgi:hypothetical protein
MMGGGGFGGGLFGSLFGGGGGRMQRGPRRGQNTIHPLKFVLILFSLKLFSEFLSKNCTLVKQRSCN